MTSQRYSVGYEWKNHRGQFFVMTPDHPNCRKDGFVSRAKLVMEILLDGGIAEDQSYPDNYAMDLETRRDLLTELYPEIPRESITNEFLLNQERVYHINGKPADDSPENLMLFPSQGALARWRSEQYHKKIKQEDQETLSNFARQSRELRERRHAAAVKGGLASKANREARAAEEAKGKK